MNTDLIPANNYYCYSGGDWDGKKFLIKICPYWKRTDHGTVKCEYLGVESLTEEAGKANDERRQLAYNHFGSKRESVGGHRRWWTSLGSTKNVRC